jgi:hypothetical protein
MKKFVMFSVMLLCSIMAVAQKTSKPGNPIDLGLSVLWADRNVGANSVEANGNIYAWPFKSGLEGTDDFSGSKEDIARKEWGGKWRMPTRKEIIELKNRCLRDNAIKLKTGNTGFVFHGPNGNTIIFPKVRGYLVKDDDNEWYKDGAFYWGGTREWDGATILYVSESSLGVDVFSIKNKFVIRPVMDK